MAANIREKINKLASERILMLDGGMGSLISNYVKKVEGYNDLLCLSRQDIISGIHEAYLKAGADIIETCSFNAAAIMFDSNYPAGKTYEVSKAAAELARNAADRYSAAEKPRFVAGSIGPTAKSASIASDMNDLSKRAVKWDELEAAYYENARGLLDGGADILLIETVFDTLNAKAAIFAAGCLAKERNIDVPLIISATVNENGRLLSGQTTEAFCDSVRHSNPLALGLNCSFGADKLKSHIAAVSAAVPCLVIAYPNAGFPNSLGMYEESPESMTLKMEEYFKEGIVNIAGGCCGSTPDHIAAISEAALKYSPRSLHYWPVIPDKNLFAGLEVFQLSKNDIDKIIDEPNRLKSHRAFELIKEDDSDGALDLLIESIEDGNICSLIYMDDSIPEAKSAMTGFINFALQYPDIARHPVILESSDPDLIEAGLKCLQGKALVKYTGSDDSNKEFRNRVKSYGAEVLGTDF